MTFKEEFKKRFVKPYSSGGERLNCTIIWEEVERFIDQYETQKKKTSTSYLAERTRQQQQATGGMVSYAPLVVETRCACED